MAKAKAATGARKPRLSKNSKFYMAVKATKHVSSAFRAGLGQQLEKDRASFAWKQRLKPSQMAFDMCLEEFYETCDQYDEFALEARLRFFFGHAVHKALADFYKEFVPWILYPRPDMSRQSDQMKAWAERVYPELPFESKHYRAKMVMDLVANIQQEPVVVDYKTTWKDQKSWIEFIKKPEISPAYIFQGASYCFHADLEKLYPVSPKKFGFVFINLHIDPIEENSWHEVYFDYAPYAEQTKLIWDLALASLEAKIEGRPMPACQNPNCVTHGSNQTFFAPVDPYNPGIPAFVREDLEYEAPVRFNPAVERARRYYADCKENL